MTTENQGLLTRQALQIIQNGVDSGSWTPTFNGVSTATDGDEYFFQKLGQTCFFHIRMQYSAGNPAVWATSGSVVPYITLPFKMTRGSGGALIGTTQHIIYDGYLIPATGTTGIIGTAEVRSIIATGSAELVLPVRTGVAAEQIQIHGHYFTE